MVTPGTVSGSPARSAAMRRHVHAAFAFGHGAAQDHVVHHRRRSTAGYFVQQTADDDGGQVVRPRVAQRARGALPTGVRKQSIITASCMARLPSSVSGLPVFSMCCMRSCVSRSPHRLRKASRSRSSSTVR